MIAQFDTAPNGMAKLIQLRASPQMVNTADHVIEGMSVIEAVEALGHGLLIDERTLEQVANFGNAQKQGVKSRYTHPGLSADGLGRHLGRMKNFRIDGNKVLADLHFAESSANTPEGDLRGYVEQLAAEDSNAAGLSIVAYMAEVWKVTDDDGNIVEVEGSRYDRPDNATTEVAFARLKTIRLKSGESMNPLRAVDLVDEPAANRSGMFSAGTTNGLAAQAFAALDAAGDPTLADAISWAEDHGIDDHAKVEGFLTAHREWRECHPINFSASGDAGLTQTKTEMETKVNEPAPSKTFTEAEFKSAIAEALAAERAEHDKQAAEEKSRIASIAELGREHNLSDEANAAIADGASVEDFTAEVVGCLAARVEELTKQLSDAQKGKPARGALTSDPDGASPVDVLLEKLSAEKDPKEKYRLIQRLREARKAAEANA